MKTFPVKYRGIVHEIIVDDSDAIRIEKILGQVIYCRGKYGSVKKRKLSYVPAWKNRGFRPAIWIEGKLVYLSRWLLGLLDPAVSHLIVDHIDQNPLNNCRGNLRIVDRRINAINSVIKREQATSSRYRGVCWNTQCNRWMAWINIPGTTTKSGKAKRRARFFKTEDEAYQERLKMEEAYYKPLLESR